MTSPRIRPAAESDAEAISLLLDELGHPLAPAEVVDRLTELRSSPRQITLVAELGAAVVGVVSAFASPVLHRVQPVGRISALVVGSAHLGDGIGTALLEAAEAFLTAQGCGRIEVTSAAHRTEAHAFYVKRGYVRQGVRFAKIASESRDAV